MAANRKFRLRIITPAKLLYDKEVDFIVMRTQQGELGVLPGHTPLTTILASGAMKIENDGEELKAAVFEGFAEVKPDCVTILSDAAEWPDEIDPDRAQKAKERAEKRLKERPVDTDLHRAEASLRRALVRLDIYAYKPQKK